MGRALEIGVSFFLGVGVYNRKKSYLGRLINIFNVIKRGFYWVPFLSDEGEERWK